MEVENEILEIKERNKRVEADKAWEISFTRKVLIAVLTYFVISIFFVAMNFEKPFVNAIIPTLGFLLSTLTLNFAKKIWLKKYPR